MGGEFVLSGRLTQSWHSPFQENLLFLLEFGGFCVFLRQLLSVVVVCLSSTLVELTVWLPSPFPVLENVLDVSVTISFRNLQTANVCKPLSISLVCTALGSSSERILSVLTVPPLVPLFSNLKSTRQACVLVST